MIRGAMTAEITEADVVGKDEHYVRPLGRADQARADGKHARGKQSPKAFHQIRATTDFR